MRRRRMFVVMSVFAMGMVYLGGCNVSTPPIQVDLPLGSTFGSVQVQANVPTQRTAVVSGGNIPLNLTNGTLEIDPSAITVTPNGSTNKPDVTAQGGPGTLTITVKVAPSDQIDTVCETGEQFGPYTVTLDENLVPTSVTPTPSLTPTTLDLLEQGDFSVCVEMVSSVDATISISSIRLNVSIGL